MNDVQKQILNKYKALKKSPMFQNLLTDIDASLNAEVHPVLSKIFTENTPNQYNGDIYSLPVGQESELEKVSTADLLRATKDIVNVLKQDIPDKLLNLDENGMDELSSEDEDLQKLSKISTLPVYLTQIQKIVSNRHGAAQPGPDDVLPANMSLTEFRLINTAHSVLGEINLITDKLHAQSEFDAQLDSQNEKFEADRLAYQEKQKDLVARVQNARFNCQNLQYHQVTIGDDGKIVDNYDNLITDLDGMADSSIFYEKGENNLFEYTIAEYNRAMDGWENLYHAKLGEMEEKFEKQKADFEKSYDEEEELINREYDDVQKEYDELKVVLKNDKKLEDYAPYNDYQSAVYEVMDYVKNNPGKVDAKYLRFNDEKSEALFCKEEDPDYYTEEIEKITSEIDEIEKMAKDEYAAADEAIHNYKSAKEANELRAGQILKKEKDDVDATIAEYGKVINSKLIIAGQISDEQVNRFTPAIKSAYNECFAKQVDTTLYCGGFEKKHKDTEIFNDLQKLVHAVNHEIAPLTTDPKYAALNELVGVVNAPEVERSYNSFKLGVTTNFADSMSVIGNVQIPMLQNKVKALMEDKNMKKVSGSLSKLNKWIDAFNKDFAPMKEEIGVIQEKRDSYLSSAKNMYSELVEERNKKFEYNKEIVELIKKAEGSDKDLKTVPEETMKELKEKNDYYQNKYLNTKSNLDYLKKCKTAFEKSKEWYAFMPGVDKLSAVERFDKCQKELDERLERINNKYVQKEDMIKKLDERFEENKALLRGEIDKALDIYKDAIEDCQKGQFHCERVRRNIEALEKDSKKLVKTRDTAAETHKKEMDKLTEIRKEQQAKHLEKENAILDSIMNSKKKIGFDSPIFKNLKSEIEKYRRDRDANPNQDILAADYKEKTAGLMSAIDTYIENRKGDKITDAGYVRLDYVRQLKNQIQSREKFLNTLDAETVNVIQKEPKINIEMKLSVEEMIFSNNPNLKKEFFDSQTYESALEKAKECTGVFNAEYTDWVNSQRRIDVVTEDGRIENALEEERIKKEEAERQKEAQQKSKEGKSKENQSSVNAGDMQITCIKPVIPDLEKAILRQPKDLHEKIREFDRIMSNVPNDYGFEQFNKDRNFFTRYSMDKYIRENKAADMFMKMNNIQNPMVTPTQAAEIADFDFKMNSYIETNFGYDDYLLDYAMNHPDLESMRKDPLLTKRAHEAKVLGLSGNIEDAQQTKLTEMRHAAAKKLGIKDPRDNIPHYGRTFLDDKAIDKIRLEQEKQMKAVFNEGNKIINEIAKYDETVAKFDPAHGFDPIPYFPKETYHALGIDRKYYMQKNNIVDVRKEYEYSIAHNTASESMKEQIANFDKRMSKMKPYFGYNEAKKASYEQQKAEYIKSGKGIELMKKEKGLVDPRITYAEQIKKSEYLTQIFAPENAIKMTSTHTDMKQLDDILDVDDYDAAGIEIVNYSIKYKDVFDKQEYDPLSIKNVVDNNQNIDKYPEDLQEKIKEYDRMISMIPNGYGYEQFERECDFEGKISEKQYTESGLGKKFFAHKHRMQDPRIPLDKAKEIKDFDEMMGGFKFDKKLDDYVKADPQFGKYQYKSEYQIARDNYITTKLKSKDPREDVQGYGRIFLKKEEYKPDPVFDETKRIEHHDVVLKDIKEYIKKVANVDPRTGWKQFEEGKGQDIEQYMSQREYALANKGREYYAQKNKIVDPFVKYKKYIDKDPELRLKVDDATKVYNEFLKEQQERIKNEVLETKEDLEFINRREEEIKKTNEAIENVAKEEAKQRKSVISGLRSYLPRRTSALMVAEIHKADGKPVSQNTLDNEEALRQGLKEYKEYTAEGMHERRVAIAKIDRYCEKLTTKDIPREEKELQSILPGLIKKYGDNEDPNALDMIEFEKRGNRLNELKAKLEAEKQAAAEKAARDKASEKLRKSPEVQQRLAEVSKQMRENGAKLMEQRKKSGVSNTAPKADSISKNSVAPEKDGLHK